MISRKTKNAPNGGREFDCLAFKDRVQAEIYEETKGMTFDQLQRYFQKRVASGPFAERWKRIPSRSPGLSRRSTRRVS